MKLKKLDILCVNETNLDKFKPQTFFKNSFYDIIRRDRDFDDTAASSHGGGILVFIKKQYRSQFIKAPEIEMIFLKIMVDSTEINFILYL